MENSGKEKACIQ